MRRSERRDVGSIPTPATREVIRLDEEPVLKTGAGETVVSSSLTASANNTRPWCNGSMAGSNPVGQGSSPWGRASGEI